MGKKVQLRTLLDCCDLITDGAHKSPKTYDKGLPYVTVRDVNDDGDIDTIGCKKINKIDFDLLAKGNCQPVKGDILFSKDGTVGKVALVDVQEPFVVLSSLAILRPNKIILNSNYFKYMMLSPNIQDEAIGLKTGAAIKRIVLKTINLIRIPLPSLPEQQRIVTKLDGLFAKINQAIGLLEDNIEHTQTLMGSVLDEEFEKLELNFKDLALHEVIKIKSGGFLSSKKMSNTNEYNVYGGNGINGTHNFYNLEGENLVIGRVGAKCGNIRLVKGPIWVTDNAFYVSEIKKNISKEFLLETLQLLNLNETANQAAQPVISFKGIRDLNIPIPDKESQKSFCFKSKILREKTNLIIKTQTKKLKHLKALKSTLLDQAFKGEL
jgi:type I restriction enzyme S subunit